MNVTATVHAIRYEDMAHDETITHHCLICRGEQVDRCDSFHAKYNPDDGEAGLEDSYDDDDVIAI